MLSPLIADANIAFAVVTILLLKRFSKTQNISIMVLEFKCSETVAGICKRFVERESARLELSKQYIGY